MTVAPRSFPYVARDPSLGNASLAPMLPVTLIGPRTVTAVGLVDSGAAINVLPLSVGRQLGFDWSQLTQAVTLAGNLASVDARVIVLSATAGSLPPVRLAFAWCQSDAVSVILGQVNFFLEFDVCFFRARNLFEVRPKP